MKKDIIKMTTMFRPIALIVALLISSCAAEYIATGNSGHVTIILNDGGAVTYSVDIANNDSSRRRGLMYRKHLPLDQGMLLDFQIPQEVSIWMKNTYIPLDILFIDKDGVIVKIVTDTLPLSTQHIKSSVQISAVLEINAKQVVTYGIQVGNQVLYEN